MASVDSPGNDVKRFEITSVTLIAIIFSSSKGNFNSYFTVFNTVERPLVGNVFVKIARGGERR